MIALIEKQCIGLIAIR